jgi:hypothetical protein
VMASRFWIQNVARRVCDTDWLNLTWEVKVSRLKIGGERIGEGCLV